jgi:hypothetical protein
MKFKDKPPDTDHGNRLLSEIELINAKTVLNTETVPFSRFRQGKLR